MNDSGQILVRDNRGHAVLNPDGTSYRLKTAKGFYVWSASCINTHGWVGGQSYDSDYRYYPTVWDSQGNGTFPQGIPGFRHCEVYAVNDAGKSVGYLSFQNSSSAVVWDASGLPTVLPVSGGYDQSTALDVNNWNWITGGTRSPGDQPCVWDDRGNVTHLPLLQGFDVGIGEAINDCGLVVGYSYDYDERRMEPVLWIPIPEPSSLAALGFGLVGMGLRFRMRRG